MINVERNKLVEIRATALYVPAGIDPEVLESCMADIKKYNSARGIPTDWDSSEGRQ